MRNILILLFLAFSLMLFVTNVDAKFLPQALKSGKVTTTTKIGSGIAVSPKLRADRKALFVYFANLQNATSVSYALTYSTDTQEEGAMGALTLDSSSTLSQELLFGTCSKGVCRYHTGVHNAKLEVSYTTKTGKKYIKRFKIKV